MRFHDHGGQRIEFRTGGELGRPRFDGPRVVGIAAAADLHHQCVESARFRGGNHFLDGIRRRQRGARDP